MGKKRKNKLTKTGTSPQPVKIKQGTKGMDTFFPWLLALAVVTAICFFPMLKNGFTNWDDEYYVVNNAMLRGPDWHAIFTQPVAANYHPLTMISLALNYQLTGLDPSSYLLVNYLFHLIDTLLVFYFIWLISGKKAPVAFLSALIFGIHPMHVESVAWVSERKDVLYTFFFLLALIQYWKYLQTTKKWNYGLCILLFILSLLSKPAAIIFPLVLFLLDYWKGRAINVKSSLEKIPFFLLAILFAVITLNIQSSTAVSGLNVFPLWTRFFFACYGVMIYFFRFFIPYPLSAFHPFPSADHLGWPVLISPVFVLALLAFLWYQRKNKMIIFGFSFFVVNLLLVLQIISVGLTIVSERYTYVPYIGLAFIAGMLLSRYKGTFAKQVSWIIPALVALIFGFITFKYIGAWKNSNTLWSNVISYYPNSIYARTNRANYTIQSAQMEKDSVKKTALLNQALEDCSVALKNDPKYILGYQNRINIFLLQNRNQEALADAESLNKYAPQNPVGYLTKGIVYTRLNEIENAFTNLSKCISLNPNADDALNMRGTLLVNNYQKFSEALTDFNKAISLNPKGEYYYGRSICNYRLGDLQHAKEDALIAMQKGISLPDSYRKLLNL